MDLLTQKKRSWNMSRIRGKNTAPELAVRSFLYHKGLRFRIHINKLPGRPDIVLPKYKTIIFVHGCFWHRHQGCKYAYIPKTRKKFWEKKFYENIKRFNEVRKILVKLGWRIIVIWECETGSIIKLRKLITVLRRKRT
jgi:DNA mismatch endonuclease (patch repair protein)